MGRRRFLSAPRSETKLLRVSASTADLCQEISKFRNTTAGEVAEYLINKHGPAELEKSLKTYFKKKEQKKQG